MLERFGVGRCCCIRCGLCPNSSSREMQVVITGFINDQCTGCPNVNATFIVPFFVDQAIRCAWKFVDNSPGVNCTLPRPSWPLQIEVTVTQATRELVVQVTLDAPAFYRVTLPNPLDCDDISAVVVPFASSTMGDCDATGATVTVTLL